MSPRRRPVPAALAATVVFLAGCSSSSTGTAAPAATTPAPTGSVEVAASPAPTASTVSRVTSTSGSKVFAEPTECGSIAQKYGSISSAMMPVLQGKTAPTPFDADTLVQAVDAGTMGTIPAEVAPDFAAFKSAAEQLRGKDLTAAATVFNGPEMSTAAAHIEKFLSDHC